MISKRLETIASLIQKDMIVADIGTDHAFLPIYLLKNKVSALVYATDNKNGPLLQAKKNIMQAQLTDHILTLLTDGLDDLPNDIEVIVIAGMGVDSIINILDKHMETLKKYQQIIVQPNNNVYHMRQWIVQHGYKITAEKLIKEYKYYQVISFDPQSFATYNKQQTYFGPCLLQTKDPLFLKYHHDHYQNLKSLYQKYPQKLLLPEYTLLAEYFKEYPY